LDHFEIIVGNGATQLIVGNGALAHDIFISHICYSLPAFIMTDVDLI
jgi:hypothetical protein